MNEPQSPGRFLAAVQRLREEVERKIGEVGERVDAIVSRVDALQEALAASQRERKDAPPRPPDWPALHQEDPEEFARLWVELQQWVATICPRYFVLNDRLLPCWPAHPDVVDVITAAWTAWRGAYGPHGRPTDAVGWQRDARPLVENYLDKALGMHCTEHGTRRPVPSVRGSTP